MSSCVGCVEFGEVGSGERKRRGGSVWEKGASGRLKRARLEGLGIREGWRGISAKLDDLFYRKR